ncbi:uncharacterized protein K460DRAFT_377721 [Cucurbitaria berberidis CBS 394.84]|uniref:Potassium channel tetramerisation-type BTB domain-containing protein n=1 Tax=Cucurbitaria berberidis CBS 394.84 TaxID=1168544 RepID=A0A9P4GHZ3_9PLEO|nr:uncharacterized protein K460DRAFT_377721 [Cucurbitaria berberidis CBS 394.84]KAF1846513.1 hypothetical protein K460DRAFT_377721 [Cucurbitaria berberidis CBS 394.84]
MSRESGLGFDDNHLKSCGTLPLPQPIVNDHPAGSSSTNTTYPKVLTLDVGGRKFKVSRDVLLEAGLFRFQFSDSFTWLPEPDGSYFLDADPELFEHLVRFMRRPPVFPLFYDKASGFDYDLYNRLAVEAEYFQLDALHEWIKAKTYACAVTVRSSAPIMCDFSDMPSTQLPANKCNDMHFVPRVRKMYLCPRGILVHRGSPGRCGAACVRARGDGEFLYEDEAYWEVVYVQKEIVFDETVCRAK